MRRVSANANRFACVDVVGNARPLITVDSKYPYQAFDNTGIESLWEWVSEMVSAEVDIDLEVKYDTGKEPIVRLIPPADASDTTIAAMVLAWKSVAAHVRVLPREHGVIAPNATPSAAVDHITVRAQVFETMDGIKSANPAPLRAMLERTMDEEGL